MLHLPKTSRSGGYTLLDLLIALSVSGILAAYALPTMNNNLQFRAERNSISQLLQMARSSSLNLNSYIAVCHLNNGICKDVSSPITVFADTNNNKQLDQGEVTIAIHHLNTHSTVQWKITERIRFEPSGRALNGTLSYCSNKAGNNKGFKIIISPTGRMRTERSNSDCV